MTSPSVTHTFVASTTASATQVNTNFTDIINALTDGTKSYSADALTLAGTLTANGHAILGSASNDDITVNGSLASSIPIKTNNSFNIGAATLGLASIYLGAPSSRATRITAHQSLGASNTLVLPDGNGTSRYTIETDGSGNLSWVKPKTSPDSMQNYGLSNAVAGNALTMTFKGADGNNLSSTNPVVFSFRNATAATGTPTELEITSNLTLTLSSGSTLGFVSGQTHYLYWYIVNNAGTPLLAVSQCTLDEGALGTTTAEGGAGAADSNALLYASSAVSTKPCRLIARTKHSLTTAGTWDEVADEISLWPFDIFAIHARYTTAAGQAANDNAIINYDTKVVDTHGIITPAATPDWACLIPQNGTYTIDWTSDITGGQGNVITQSVQASLQVDAAQVIGGSRDVCNVTSARIHSSIGSATYKLTKGQVLRIGLESNLGTAKGTLTASASKNVFTITRTGP